MTEDTKDMSTLAEWIEPEVRTLAAEETAGFPGIGSDGGGFFDCTLS